MFIAFLIHLTNLDIQRIVYANTLYPQTSSQACCYGCCGVHGKMDSFSLGADTAQ